MFNFDTKKKLSSSKAQSNRARIEKGKSLLVYI